MKSTELHSHNLFGVIWVRNDRKRIGQSFCPLSVSVNTIGNWMEQSGVRLPVPECTGPLILFFCLPLRHLLTLSLATV
jgi:hypothetical protein